MGYHAMTGGAHTDTLQCLCQDHRLNKNFPLQTFLGGDVEGIIQECIFMDQQAKLKEMVDA